MAVLCSSQKGLTVCAGMVDTDVWRIPALMDVVKGTTALQRQVTLLEDAMAPFASLQKNYYSELKQKRVLLEKAMFNQGGAFSTILSKINILLFCS